MIEDYWFSQGKVHLWGPENELPDESTYWHVDHVDADGMVSSELVGMSHQDDPEITIVTPSMEDNTGDRRRSG